MSAEVAYAAAFLFMAAAGVVELNEKRRPTWALLVSISWAIVMFHWWNP